MYGFFDNVIGVDLAAGQSRRLDIPPETWRTRLGAKGLATWLLLRLNPKGIDPLAPENNLILAVGQAAGTGLWGSCRYGVFTKSPLTGLYAESYSGGTVAERMAQAGVDALVLSGASPEPVWVEVGEDGVKLHSAADLWGLETYEAERRIKAWIKENRPRSGQAGVAVIGPAGERMVRIAMINNDLWRQAGRAGTGAVMGSKKVKAIAFWGGRTRPLADPQAIKTYAKEFLAKHRQSPAQKAFKSMGTPMMVDILDHVGAVPTRYWQLGKVPHRESINAQALHTRLKVTPRACLKCFMACGRLSEVLEGPHKGLVIDGPEYETIYSFGALCMIESIEEITYLNDLCDRLGLDTISAGNLCAFAIEAARRGRIKADLDYNRPRAVARLVEDIALGRGLGEVLSQGIRPAAQAWGLEDLAVHVKGMEPAGYDPRVFKGMGLAYGTSDRGACHQRSTFFKLELAGISPSEQIEGKAAHFVEWEDRHTLMDTFVFCRFYRDFYPLEEMAVILRGLTGQSLGAAELRAIAKNVTDDTRRFNLREGLRPEQDHLPERIYKEPLPETGAAISRADMTVMLDDYYHLRGWDQAGSPSLERS